MRTSSATGSAAFFFWAETGKAHASSMTIAGARTLASSRAMTAIYHRGVCAGNP